MTKSWLRFRERSCASRPITMGIFGCRFSCIFFASILSIAIKIINMQHAACNIRQTTLVCNRWGVFSVQDCRGEGQAVELAGLRGQFEAEALFIFHSQTRRVCRFTSRMNNTFPCGNCNCNCNCILLPLT